MAESIYPILCKPNEEIVVVTGANYKTPFWLTLAHELIHAKHKLEAIENNLDELKILKSTTQIEKIPYYIATNIDIDSIFLDPTYNFLYDQLPELSILRINMNGLWTNLEERRTVIGPDSDGISEASIRASVRIEDKLPTRYIYQNHDTRLKEPTDIVANCLQSVPPIFLKSIIKADIGTPPIPDEPTSNLTFVNLLTPEELNELIENMRPTQKMIMQKILFSSIGKEKGLLEQAKSKNLVERTAISKKQK